MAARPGISRNAPRYLEELRRTQWLPRAELEHLQLRRLRRLVAHAADHVGYWRELLETAGVSADDMRGLDDLRRIPISPRVRCARTSTSTWSPTAARSGKIAKVTTSGNTGEPLCRVRRSACSATCAGRTPCGTASGRAGVRGAAPPARPRTGRRTRAASWRCPGGCAAPWFPVRRLGADAVDVRFVRLLEERVEREPPVLLEADAEMLGSVAALRGDRAASPWTRAVISTGQTLAPELRALIEGRLGARVFDRYGAREFGAVAQQCEAGGWHVNAESMIVEVERDGRPAAPGEAGELLVTDLNNRCVPLLRYRLGDVAVATDRPCSCGRGLPLLERIGGRAAGVVLGDGDRQVPAGFFADLFGDYEFAVSRWQVEQPCASASSCAWCASRASPTPSRSRCAGASVRRSAAPSGSSWRSWTESRRARTAPCGPSSRWPRVRSPTRPPDRAAKPSGSGAPHLRARAT